MKLKEIKLRNLKGYTEAHFNELPQCLRIVGNNSAGKTTIMQALMAAVWEDKRVLPPQFIRFGEELGEGEFEFEDPDGNAFTLRVEMKKGKNGKENMKVSLTSHNGSKWTTKGDRQEFWGNPVLFRVDKFMENQRTKSGREENVKKYLSPLMKIDFDFYSNEIIKLIENRKAKKAELNTAKTVIKSHGISEAELNEVSTEKVDVEPLRNAQSLAQRFHTELSRAQDEMKSFSEKAEAAKKTVKSYKEKIEEERKALVARLGEEIEALMKRLEDAEQEDYVPENMAIFSKEIPSLEKSIPEFEKKAEEARKRASEMEESGAPDLDEANKKLEEAIARNQRIDSFIAVKEELKKKEVIEGELEEIEVGIEATRAELLEMVEENRGKLPPQFSLKLEESGEFQLYWKENGKELPLMQNQLETSREIMASVFLGMALNANAKLKMVIIERGESLDRKTLAAINEACEAAGFTVLAEYVTPDHNGDIPEIHSLSIE